MAVTPVTLNQVSHLTASVLPNTTGAAVDAANGNSVQNTGQTFLRFTNTNAATYTVSVAIPVTVDGQTVTAISYVIPATTGDVVVGAFPSSIYGSTLTLSYTGTTTNGKVAAFTL